MLTKRKMGDLIQIKHGFPFLGEHFTDEGEYIVLTPGNFFEAGGFKRTHGKEKFYDADFPKEYLCSEGDLVVAMTQQAEGLLGSTALIPESGVYLHNQRIGLISCDKTLAEKFFIYYLFMISSVRQQIRRTASGSKVKHTSPERIYDVIVWTPDVPTQERIGSILQKIDRKISLNNAINAELESAARTLYDYWFTQFDFPNENGKPYKSSGGAMEYIKELKREIPKGWKVGRLPKNALCELISSGVDEFEEEKIYLSTSEVNGMEIIDHTITVDYGTRPARANMQPTMNSVWFAKMKDTLKHLLVSDGADVLISDYLLSTGFGGLQCTEDSIYYVWNYLNAGYFESKKNQIATGATQQAINDTDLKEFFIIVPASDVLKKFTTAVAPYYRLICRNRFQSKDLTELRDFLLPLLMNGQVRVATTETAAEVAAEVKLKPVAAKEPSKRDTIFKRLVLSAYLLDNICDEPTAGRVKFEKLLYLSEHCAQLPLHSEFQRAAAGPYDSKSLYSIESQLNQNKWFKRQKITGESRAYTRLAKIDGYKQYVGTNLTAAQKTVIDKLIALFKTSRTIQCEIVATLYGAWNDFLLEGIQPTEDQIVNEVLTNWHEKKERISRDRWLSALQWMRNEGLIPVGYGVSTKGGTNA